MAKRATSQVKHCNVCGVELVVGENCWDGYYKCKDCKLAYNRRWDAENKAKRRAYSQKWRSENPRKVRAIRRAHYEKNAEEAREYARQYRQENASRVREYNRQYYEDNREKMLERVRQWKLDNPEKHRESERRRRARLNECQLGVVDEEAIRKRCGECCFYCGSSDDLTLDHIVPISSGGTHCTDNLVVACRSCNGSKGSREIMDWLNTQPYSRPWLF